MQLRVAAYAVIVDEQGVLLAHWKQEHLSGWTLPGGGLDPGEDPADAAVREVAEETGYRAELQELLGIDSIVIDPARRLGGQDEPLHALRIIYRARLIGGSLRDELDGTTDQAGWFPLAEVAGLDRVPLVDVGLRLAGLEPAGD